MSVTSPRVVRIAVRFYAAIMVMRAQQYSLSRIANVNLFGAAMLCATLVRKRKKFSRAVERFFKKN